MYTKQNVEISKKKHIIRDYVLQYQKDNPSELLGCKTSELQLEPNFIVWNAKELDVAMSIMYYDLVAKLINTFPLNRNTMSQRRDAINRRNAIKLAWYESRFKDE